MQCRFLIAVASLIAEHRLSACQLQQLWPVESAVVVCGRGCLEACEIFPDQGSHPCLLQGQVESSPLGPQKELVLPMLRSKRVLVVCFAFSAAPRGILVPRPGIEPVTLALEARSLNC